MFSKDVSALSDQIISLTISHIFSLSVHAEWLFLVLLLEQINLFLVVLPQVIHLTNHILFALQTSYIII